MSLEILKKAAGGEKTSRHAAIMLTSGVFTAKRLGRTLGEMLRGDPKETAEKIIAEYRLYGTDLIWAAADLNHTAIEALGGKCEFDRFGFGATVVKTPAADVGELLKLDPHDVAKSADIQNQVEMAKIIKDTVGDEFAVGISSWGAFTLAGLMLDTEEFMVTLITEPEDAKKAVEFAAEVAKEFYKPFIAAGVDLLCMSDPSSSGDLISKQMFGDFSLPSIKDIATFAHKNGKISMLHICGNTSSVVGDVAESGVDVFSFDSKVPLTDAISGLDGKVTAAGNLNPTEIMLKGTPEKVSEAVKENIAVSNGARYIVMPGCDTPPDSPIENIKAMVAASGK